MVLTEGLMSLFHELKDLLIGHCFEGPFANTRTAWKKCPSICVSVPELVLLYANYSGHL